MEITKKIKIESVNIKLDTPEDIRLFHEMLKGAKTNELRYIGLPPLFVTNVGQFIEKLETAINEATKN